MFCAGLKRKRCQIEDSNDLLENSPNLKGRSLLSPLKSLQLSPIPRALSGGVKAAKENIKPMSLQDRGQLKICIYVNSGLLTIHVIQAKNIMSSNGSLCSSFVRVAVVPDDSKRLRCKTEIVPDSNKPFYDQKFSYELSDKDRKRRLVFSVFNRNSERTEFLGCMSFGIQSILIRRKSVSGWYYLLPEDFGKKKHLQAHRCKIQVMEKVNSDIHTINKDLRHMESRTVVIRKDLTGYGFSLMGSCPTKIGRIELGSPADDAGLQTDDCIVRLNGINVSRSSVESVANLVRESEFVALEIQRPHRDISMPPDDTLKNPLSSTLQTSHGNSREDYKENTQGLFYRKRAFHDRNEHSVPMIQRAF